MATQLREFERYKLNTKFRNGRWEHSVPGGRIERWKVGRIIGKGAHGTVRLAGGENGAIRAIKKIKKITASNISSPKELLALTKLDAYPEYFVQFFGWWDERDNIYFAMEYVGGGDLMALILENDLSEDDAKTITRQLLEGLQVMHAKGFCHRDLKPQNVLVASRPPGPLVVKIADFGCSKNVVGTALQSLVGTYGYMAPEIWGYRSADSSVYTSKVDIWSLGCLIYVIVAKEPPLQDIRDYLAYIEDRTPFPAAELVARGASAAEVQFIMNLMMAVPNYRLTAEQALRDPWLDQPTEDKETFSDPVTPLWEVDGQTFTLDEAREVLVLLSFITKVNLRTQDTILHCTLLSAAQEGPKAVMRLLLKHGVHITAKDNEGKTSLHLAAFAGYGRAVKLLLVVGADIMAKDHLDQTPLHCAAYAGHKEVVQTLLASGADIIGYDRNGFTPVDVAARRGHDQVVAMLEEAADMAVENSSRTPLDLGGRTIQEHSPRLLGKEGEDTLVSRSQEQAPLHYPTLQGHKPAVTVLESEGADTVSSADDFLELQLAVSVGGHLLAEALTRVEAAVTAKNDRGQTYLHRAAAYGDQRMVELLLERAADIMAIDNHGRQPLHVAALNGKGRVARTLLDGGAWIAAEDNDGCQPLHLAAANGHHRVVRMLLQRAADHTATDNTGRQPLHLAGSNGLKKVVRALLESGADVEAKDKDGHCALHLAARNGHGDTIRSLIEKGADTEALGHEGLTPLQGAALGGHVDAVRALLDIGASITAPLAGLPVTALAIARAGGNWAVVELLVKKKAATLA